MKCLAFAVGIAALIPPLVHAQNTPFTNCRTIEAAGSFVGPDEALVDGMVCKVLKTKASPSGSGTTAATEKRRGAIDSEAVQSKTKADANPTVGLPTTGTMPDTHANPKVDVAPPTPGFEPIPEGSLGDIARAYRKKSQPRVATVPEGLVVRTKPSADARPAPTSPATAPDTATTSEPRPEATSGQSVRAKAPEAELKPELTPTTNAPASVIPAPAANTQPSVAPLTVPSEVKPEAIPAPGAPANVEPAEPQQAAKTEVTAAPPTAPAAGAETNLPQVVSPPAAAPELPSNKGTPVFASAQTPSSAQREVSPVAVGAPEEAPTREQETVKLGVFVAPQTSATDENGPSQPDSGTMEDDFNEGQHAGCTKNISLGSLDKEQLFLAIPDWATKWYAKNQSKFPGVCFSNSPMPSARNYLIVFHQAAPPVSAIETVAKTAASTDVNSVSELGTFTTSFGSTWHYTYEQAVSTTVTTASAEKVPHNQPSNVLYATAYSEQGIPISQHWPVAETKRSKETSVKRRKSRDLSLPGVRAATELLDQMIEDILMH